MRALDHHLISADQPLLPADHPLLTADHPLFCVQMVLKGGSQEGVLMQECLGGGA